MSNYPEEPLLDNVNNNNNNPYHLSPPSGQPDPATHLSTAAPASDEQHHQSDHGGSHPALQRLLVHSREFHANINRILMVLPGVTISSAREALLKCRGGLDEAINLLVSTEKDVEIAPSVAPSIAPSAAPSAAPSTRAAPSARASPSTAPPAPPAPATARDPHYHPTTRVSREQMQALKKEYASYPRHSNDEMRRRHRERTAAKVGVIASTVAVKFGEFIRMEKRALQKAANEGFAVNNVPQGYWVNRTESRTRSSRR